MEENQPKTGKLALIFGGLSGITGIVFSVLLYLMDMQYEQGFAIKVIQFLILATFVVLAIIQFKKSNSGLLKVIEAVKIAPGVAVISFIIGIIWFLLFSNVIEPDFMAKSAEIAKVKTLAENPKMTPEQFDQGMKIQQDFFWVLMCVFMLISAIFATIVGLITGLILKKEDAAY